MSRLEEAAKPILLPMFRGEPVHLANEDQTRIVNWISVKVMVSEFSKPDDYCTSSENRLRFFETREIPANLEIWLGNCGEDRWSSAHFRQGATYGPPGFVPPRIPPKNTQTVAIGFGQLFIIALAQPEGIKMLDLGKLPGTLSRLWPPASVMFAWPPAAKLTLGQADDLALVLDQIPKTGRVLWKPWPSE
jgi:hypothetical protein